jgi:hypothetical protein
MEQLFSPTTLLISTLFGLMASYFAVRKKWNPYLWFFIGFIFGIFGLFAFFLSPQKKRRRRKSPQPKQQEAPKPILQGPADKLWFYLDTNHAQVGPISYSAMMKALHLGQISNNTYVWHENLEDWKKAEDLITTHSM